MKNLFNYISKEKLLKKIREAIEEDVKKGDITSTLLFGENEKGEFYLLSKDKGILCGREVFNYVFKEIDKNIRIRWRKDEGDEVKKNEIVAEIKGRVLSILKAERTALNFISHLSGVATITRKMVDKGKGIIIKDTRKTIPLLRELQKYAVYVGGGKNHRMSLSEGYMIKDNHKRLKGLKNILELIKKKKLEKKVILEIENLSEFKLALNYGIKYIILDNMDIKEIKKAVMVAGGCVFLEVSGKVNLKNIEKISKTGIDAVSCGFLTHSVKALDFSIEAKGKVYG